AAGASPIYRRAMGPEWGSRDSGNRADPAAKNTAITGRLIRNTDPHLACAKSQPPVIGPSAAPPANIEPHTAMARRRWRRSTKMLRISDNVDGISVAPKNPSNARAAISTVGLGL